MSVWISILEPFSKYSPMFLVASNPTSSDEDSIQVFQQRSKDAKEKDLVERVNMMKPEVNAVVDVFRKETKKNLCEPNYKNVIADHLTVKSLISTEAKKGPYLYHEI